MGKRVAIDCRDHEDEKGCSAEISGEEKDVLPLAVIHAIDYHGDKDTPELKKHIKTLLKEAEDKRGG